MIARNDPATSGSARLGYGDSSYGSGEARAAYRDAGHDTVIKPGAAPRGGFTLDFAIDEGRFTCPAGVTRPMSKTRTVTFGAACAGYPLCERCKTAKDRRSMTIHPHENLLRAARAHVFAATQDVHDGDVRSGHVDPGNPGIWRRVGGHAGAGLVRVSRRGQQLAAVSVAGPVAGMAVPGTGGR